VTRGQLPQRAASLGLNGGGTAATAGNRCYFQTKIYKYDITDFCLEIAAITRVMAIKAKGSTNYGSPCI